MTNPTAQARVVGALRWLVDLKEGPRDDAYQQAKRLAWIEARDALNQFDAETSSSPSEGGVGPR